MLPRPALHEENLISNEQLNRQRVEAGLIAPIFSVNPCLPLFVFLSLLLHYASLLICRFLCEVACLSVKSTMCTHSKHVIMSTRALLSRTWLQVPEVKFRRTAQQEHRRIQREVIQHNLRLFHRLSSPSWSFYFSLSGYHVFFYIYYTTLEFVCFIAHLYFFYITLELV
jgi:hypothetical protein